MHSTLRVCLSWELLECTSCWMVAWRQRVANVLKAVQVVSECAVPFPARRASMEAWTVPNSFTAASHNSREKPIP